PNVRPAWLPRMADFAIWAEACCRGAGWDPDTFLGAYSENRRAANESLLSLSPLVEPLQQLLADGDGTWEGKASELLDELSRRVGEAGVKRRDWPKLPHFLSSKLRRLAPNLRRALGIEVVDCDRSGKSRGLRITQIEEWCKSASSASSASPGQENRA